MDKEHEQLVDEIMKNARILGDLPEFHFSGYHCPPEYWTLREKQEKLVKRLKELKGL